MANHNISQKTKDALKESRKQLLNMVDVLDRILYGNLSQADAAKELGLTPQKFQSQNDANFLPFIKRKDYIIGEDLLQVTKELETPLEAFVKDVLGISEQTTDKIYIIELEPGERFMEELKKRLTPQELEVIKLRYGFSEDQFSAGMRTYEEIASVFSISRERTRQIICKALRKARYPAILRSILSNYDEYVATMEEETNLRGLYQSTLAKCEAAKSSIRWFRSQMEFGETFEKIASKVFLIDIPEFQEEWMEALENSGIKTVYDLAVCLKENPQLQGEYPFDNQFFKRTCDLLGIGVFEQEVPSSIEIPLEEAELSVRSFNALHRRGITTVNQLIFMKEEDLKEIRNLGQKSIKEIMKFIDEERGRYLKSLRQKSNEELMKFARGQSSK